MKFSITIPAYKRQFLAEAIESCLSQTYRDFELVIVNDASPEDLDAVVGSYSDERIRYYKNDKNCGAVNVVDNWNKCLEYAVGDYFICMGDDDKLYPHCLEEYANLIEKYPGLGVYHAWTEIIDENSNFVNITASRSEYESVYSLIWHRWDNREQQYIGDFLYKTELLKRNGGFYKLPLAWGTDDISAAIAASYNGIANTQRLCFCYRINSLTISNTSNAETKLMAIDEEMLWYSKFLQDEPKDELDKSFWKCIKLLFKKHFDKKKGLTIASDLRGKSLLNIVKWLPKLKKYKLSYRILLYAVIQAKK